VAEQEKVLLLDHITIISDTYDRLGQNVVRPLFEDGILHTNTAGAIINAEMFVPASRSST
jgi:hypothetical protein